MQKIYTLDPHEVQKIAAGEVIERPAGVLKECIENGLDAGATKITIWIEQTGKKLIRILDNGHGMHPDDLPRALQPFATSKIKKLDDLQSIQSFGFRGEALASIAAISKITLRSQETDALMGKSITAHAGIVQHEESIAMEQGTEILIEDIFFNTPVRKKFLRADETEWHAILQTIHAFCLSNLNVDFRLFRDQNLALQAPAVTNFQDRICQLWGLPLAQNMLPLEYQNHKEQININGIISNPTIHRYNRQQIVYFINGRLIKNNSMAKAILKGYGSSLPEARFPCAVLLISMPGMGIDVNIHPRKEEVRFTKPGLIDNSLTEAVRTHLEQQVSKQLSKTIAQHSKQDDLINTFFSQNNTHQPEKQKLDPFKKILLQQEKKPLSELFKHDSVITFNTSIKESIPSPIHNIITTENNEIHNPPMQEQQQEKIMPEQIILPRLIGQFDATYLLLETDDELIMIDQHAAHERILYEQWKSKFEKKEGSTLLFPHTIELPKIERNFIVNMHTFFADQGFEIEPFGPESIIVSAAPPHIQGVDIVACIKELAALHAEEQSLSSDELRKKLNEHMHSHLACKAAVKAGDELSTQAQLQLVKDLFSTPNRHICIHGRPTIWTLPKQQIAKQFRRPS
jgi:DNA mismatch repair protein MutL